MSDIEDQELIEMSQNDNYTTGNLLDYLCHQKCYKLIAINLLRQTNKSIPKKLIL